MSILDPHFQYIPAVATDVSQTWKRFGFSPRANETRRAKVTAPGLHRRSITSETCAAGAETAAQRLAATLQAKEKAECRRCSFAP